MPSAWVVLAALAALAAGCGGRPGPSLSPSAGLTYAVDAPRSMAYRMGDTATVTVDGGAGGAFGLSVRASGLLDMEMTPGAGDSTRVEVRFRKFGGSMSTPMAGTITATEEEISGSLVFTLDRRGSTRIEERPELGGRAAQFLDPGSLARELFPRFPASRPDPGESWSDSLTYTAGDPKARTRAVVTRRYTLAGDTVVDGRRLLRIGYDGTARYDVKGTRMGMEMRQELEGPLRGELLWDPESRVMVRNRSEKELAGTMEIPAVGVPGMGLRLRGTTTVRLEGPGPGEATGKGGRRP